MIESATGANKEEDPGPVRPPGERTPPRSATLEPEKTDRAERPLSSEYSSPEGQIAAYTVAMFFSVVLYPSPSPLLTSVVISFSFFSDICLDQLPGAGLEILLSG